MSRHPGIFLLVCIAATASAAELDSIAITPANPVIGAGAIQPMVATGTFVNATTARLGNATLGTGGNHVCVVVWDGRVRCWGRNAMGQLGNGGGADAFVPVPVSGITTAVGVAAGHEHSCAVLADGSARCWGRNDMSQLGNGLAANSAVPVTVTGLAGAISIGTGFLHSCALLANGGVRCWGANNLGQLGNGSNTTATTPVAAGLGGPAFALAVGGQHTCAILADHTVQCWGANNAGQLGNGSLSGSSTPVNVTGITEAVAIGAGFDHTCVIIANSAVRCWGRNFEGELGNGTTSSGSALPVVANVPSDDIYVAITGGLGQTCALRKNGAMLCWGTNSNGQLGNGTVVGGTSTPGSVQSFEDAVAIGTAYSHTCAVGQSGFVYCWGLNDGGQLGNGSTVQRTGTPGAANGIATAVAAGGNYGCVILPSGKLSCWGSNAVGQLGNGNAFGSFTPGPVTDLRHAIAVSAGTDHACALVPGDSGTEVWCWGHGDLGQLGVGGGGGVLELCPTACARSPVLIPPDTLAGTPTAIAAGDKHTCVVVLLADTTSRVQCWGANNKGQAGTGVVTARELSPAATVAGITNAVAVTAGFEHSCALLATGFVRCWGRGDEGQLGTGNLNDSLVAINVTGISTATTIAAGHAHTCARLSTNEITCWGRGDEGQLGNDSTADSSTPVDTINDGGAQDVVAGDFHNCLRAGGFIRCWGRGDSGQIGIGSFDNRGSPQPVSGINTAVDVDAGESHSCAVLSSGAVQCWGSNSSGQLAQNSNVSNSTTALTVSGMPMDAVALFWSFFFGDTVSIGTTGAAKATGGFGTNPLTASYGDVGAASAVTVADDTDADGVLDPLDNCTEIPNADQRDSNGDGYGNVCDADLDNSDGIVNFADLALFRTAFGTVNADSDFNGNGGIVNFGDLALFRGLFGKPPGPSGLVQR